MSNSGTLLLVGSLFTNLSFTYIYTLFIVLSEGAKAAAWQPQAIHYTFYLFDKGL